MLVLVLLPTLVELGIGLELALVPELGLVLIGQLMQSMQLVWLV